MRGVFQVSIACEAVVGEGRDSLRSSLSRVVFNSERLRPVLEGVRETAGTSCLTLTGWSSKGGSSIVDEPPARLEVIVI